MMSTISIPDYSSISKRRISIPWHALSQALELGSFVIVDSTGLKVYGKDEWHQEKHGYCHVVKGRASEVIERKYSLSMQQDDPTSNVRSLPPTPRRLACVPTASLARSCCSGSA
jgi:hypothetical protein